jgi:hypothetical protein
MAMFCFGITVVVLQRYCLSITHSIPTCRKPAREQKDTDTNGGANHQIVKIRLISMLIGMIDRT